MNRWNKRFWSKWTAFPSWACFDGGGGAGAGAGSGGGSAAGSGGSGSGSGTGGQGAGNANTGGQQAGGSGGDGGQGDKKPFAIFPDQASFDARVKREGKAQLEAMAKELGYESAEAMQAAAKAKKEADDAAKSEAEKEKARADKAEAEKKAALEAANKRLVDAEIKVFASQVGFADPGDAVALADRANIKVDDATGAVTGAKEAVEALAKVKPHLLGKGTGGSGNIGGSANPGGGGQGGGDDAGKFGEALGKKQQDQFKKQQDSQNLYFK